MIAFLPLVTILLVAFVIFIYLKKPGHGPNIYGGFKSKWILGGYAVILMIAFAFLVIKGPEESVAYKNPGELADARTAENEIIELLYNGKVDKAEAAYKKEQWDFSYDQQNLDISLLEQEYQSFILYTERKETNDNQIEIMYLATPTIVGDMDLSNKITTPSVELTGETLTINPNSPVLKIARSTKEFTISQFTDDPNFVGDMGMAIGARMLYMRVPKDLVLNGHVQFVGE